jgi:hypothetical protein
MFGLFKKKKKQNSEFDARIEPFETRSAPPSAFNTPFPLDESGYFLNDRDIKVIVNACVFFAKNSNGYEDVVDRIPVTGGRLRDKTELSPDDITVISICLQAYNDAVCEAISENPESPSMQKLRSEKVYFLTIIEKLTRYMTAA